MRNQTSRTHTYRYNKTKGLGVNWTNFIRARAVGFGAVEETNTLNLSLERFVKQLDKASRDEALKKCDGMKIDPSFGHVEGHSEVTLRVATSMFNEFIVSRTKRKSQMLILWGRISLRSSEIKILDDRTLRLTIPPYCLPPPNVDYGSRNLREQVFVRISVDEGSNWTVGRFTYIRNRIPPVRSGVFSSVRMYRLHTIRTFEPAGTPTSNHSILGHGQREQVRARKPNLSSTQNNDSKSKVFLDKN